MYVSLSDGLELYDGWDWWVPLDWSDYEKYFADVNGDGSINIMDALLVAQYSVGIVDTLSCN